MKPFCVPFFFHHNFSVVASNFNNRGRIQINEFEWHSLPLPFNSNWSAVFGQDVFVLSSTTTKTVLMPVSCDHMRLFDYDDKKAREVDHACWFHLSNIIYDSMRQGVTCFVLFCFVFFIICLLSSSFTGWYFVFLRMKKMESVSSVSINMGKT